LASAQRILIVSQTFPPYAGIGGRRWAKFVKYLSSAGSEVRVICADLNVEKISPWTGDVAKVSLRTYEHSFPKVVEQFPKNITERVTYRLQLAKLKKISQGTPYDRALLDEASFKEVFLKELEEFQPDITIVTGAPFYLLHYAVGFKKQFPETKFVADFRDPWTWGSSYGYSELSEKRLAYEKSLERTVVCRYDLIISPWPSIVENLKDLYPDCSSNIQLLEHGYDPDDFTNSSKKSSGYDLIFGGTIYSGMEQTLRDLLNYSENKLKVGVFSNDLEKLNVSASHASLSPLIASVEFFNLVSNSKAVLMLIPKHMKDGIPSKLFEYAYLGTPILAVGYRGALSEFVESNNFGVFIDNLNELDKSVRALSNTKNDRKVLLNYNFENLTKKLLNFLNTL